MPESQRHLVQASTEAIMSNISNTDVKERRDDGVSLKSQMWQPTPSRIAGTADFVHPFIGELSGQAVISKITRMRGSCGRWHRMASTFSICARRKRGSAAPSCVD